MDMTQNDFTNIIGALQFGAKYMVNDMEDAMEAVPSDVRNEVINTQDDCSKLADFFKEQEVKSAGKKVIMFEKITGRQLLVIMAACSFAHHRAGDYSFYAADSGEPVPLSVVQRFQRECGDIYERFAEMTELPKRHAETLH